MMIEIRFNIEGNHKSPTGNPIGYKRVLKQHYRADSAEYDAYRHFFLNMVRSQNPTIHALPFAGRPRIRLDLDIGWANERHGDADNVVKMVLDTLFEDDKEVEEIHVSVVHCDKGFISGKITTH